MRRRSRGRRGGERKREGRRGSGGDGRVKGLGSRASDPSPGGNIRYTYIRMEGLGRRTFLFRVAAQKEEKKEKENNSQS